MKISAARLELAVLLVAILLGGYSIVRGWQFDASTNMELYNQIFLSSWPEDKLGDLRQIYHGQLPKILTPKFSYLASGILTCATSAVFFLFLKFGVVQVKIQKRYLVALLIISVFAPQLSWSINDWIHNLIANPCLNSADLTLCEFRIYYSTEYLPPELFRSILFLFCALVAIGLMVFVEKQNPDDFGFMNSLDVIGTAFLAIAVSALVTFSLDQRYSAMGLFPTFFSWFLFWHLSMKSPDASEKALSANDV